MPKPHRLLLLAAPALIGTLAAQTTVPATPKTPLPNRRPKPHPRRRPPPRPHATPKNPARMGLHRPDPAIARALTTHLGRPCPRGYRKTGLVQEPQHALFPLTPHLPRRHRRHRGRGLDLRRVHPASPKPAATAWRSSATTTSSPANPTPASSKDTRLQNIYAVLKGTDPAQTGRRVLVTGHYDSRNSDNFNTHDPAPGANDDASGVAVSLESARALSKLKFPGDHRLPHRRRRRTGPERKPPPRPTRQVRELGS